MSAICCDFSNLYPDRTTADVLTHPLEAQDEDPHARTVDEALVGPAPTAGWSQTHLTTDAGRADMV